MLEQGYLLEHLWQQLLDAGQDPVVGGLGHGLVQVVEAPLHHLVELGPSGLVAEHGREGPVTRPWLWHERPLAVCVPGDRPVRAGHRRLRLATAGRRFFEQAIATTKVSPTEVVTDRAPTYPLVLEELLPAAWRQTERYANNGIVRRARRGDLMPDRRLGFSLR
jgi:hypothetical protein